MEIAYDFEQDLKNGKFIGKKVEDILEVSLETKLRMNWARDFFVFYNIPTISVHDVVNKNYSQADLPQDINERFACVTSLLLAEKEEVGICREFIRKYCDPEYLELYDLCWVGKDLSRMEKLMELKTQTTDTKILSEVESVRR